MTKGAQNETIELYTNFFQIINRPDWILYQYHVDFDPPIESKSFQLHCVKAIDSERMGESPYLKANSLMIEDDDSLTMSRTDLSVLWQQQTTFKAKLKNYLLKLVKSPENQMYSEVQQHRIEILFHRVLSL